ncbi:MAG: DEAD/DEAH box helicase, partial [Coprobacillus sp.]
MKLFEQYQLKPFIKETLHEMKFEAPTKIQRSVIPLVYKHTDIIGISQTGTGKTHAFLIPIMDMIDVDS